VLNALQTLHTYSMPPTRSLVLNLRVEPGLKEGLRIAAEREHRSLANMIEWLIKQHCRKVGITIPKQADLLLEETDGSEDPDSAR
jgi:hypothetical protein